MTNKDQENEALLAKLEQNEVGVTELLEFYADIEIIYTASVQALQEGQTIMASGSTNYG
jgi:hypothetical protein